MKKRISLATPDLSGDEERYVVDAIRSSWISSTGNYIDRFEMEFAELYGANSAIGVCKLYFFRNTAVTE